jgi:sugar lactone lactonase YvrE
MRALRARRVAGEVAQSRLLGLGEGARVVRILAVLGLALLVALLAASRAAAASCGLNVVCPYRAAQVFGDTDPASLDGPLAIALAPGGDVVISDQSKESVREFSPSGQLVRQIGTPGSYNDVDGVAVDQSSGEIWVSDALGVYGFARDGTPQVTVQTWAATAPPGFQPGGIAVGPGGELYVFDPQSSSIVEYSPAGAFEAEWAVPPPPYYAGSGATLAVDGAGNVYVAFVDFYGAVEEYSSAGVLVASLAPGSLPTSIAIYGSTLYVESDMGSEPEIDTYDLSGNLEQRFPEPGLTSDGTTLSPTFAVGATGIDAITDDHQVQQLTLDGIPTGSWGDLANDDFIAGQALADSAGNVYVLDGANGRIIRYDAQGDPPTVFADVPAISFSTMAFNPEGDLVVESGETMTTVDQAGNVIATVQLPCTYCGTSFAIDPVSGDWYVADANDLQKYTPTGTLLADWPIHSANVATDAAGNVYVDAVSDFFIHKYSPTGQLLQTISVSGSLPFAMAGAVAVDAEGHVYTATGSQIREFDAAGTMIAVWPYTPSPLAVYFNGGPLSVAADGDVYLGSGTTVTRYSDFLDPLPPIPTSPLPPTPIPFPSASPSLDRAAGTLQLSRGIDLRLPSMATTIGCTGSAGVTCAGELRLTTTTRLRHAHSKRSTSKVTPLGAKAFSIPTGDRAAEVVALDAAARRLLASAAKLNTTLTATYRAGTNIRTISEKLVLRQHAHKHG